VNSDGKIIKIIWENIYIPLISIRRTYPGEKRKDKNSFEANL
jgi:hypothetical protein